MKTVIFDLDGTLLNTIDTITFYANKALGKFGFKTFVADDYKYFVGNGAVKLIERALAASGEYTKEDFDKVFKYYNEIYNADSLYLTRPYDGIVEMLKKLKSAGIKTGVISNKPDFATVDVVKKVLGEGLIDICHGARDSFPLKPDPSSTLDILSELSGEKGISAFVGDTSVDIATGKAAGLHTIGVKWGFRTEEELKDAGAEFIISHPDELCDIIINL